MSKTVKDMIAKPAIHGVVSALAIDMLAGEQKNFVYNDTPYPVWQLGAGLGVVTSFSTEFISNLILPHIPGNAKFQHLESVVLHLAASGATFALVPKLLNGNLNMEEAKKFAMVGMLAEAVSTYAYETWLAVEEVF